MTRLISTLVLAVLLGGCTIRMADLTISSTRNIDMSRMSEFKRGPRIVGEDVAHIILFIPTQLQPNIEDAIDDAIDKVPGCIGLTDVVLRRFGWWFLYGQAGWEVQGTALIDPAAVSVR